jgi:hypothetical protein
LFWHTKRHGRFAVVLPQSRAHRLHFSTELIGEVKPSTGDLLPILLKGAFCNCFAGRGTGSQNLARGAYFVSGEGVDA